MDWLYKNTPIKDANIDITQYVGFIYKITHKESGKYYIGKKNFYSSYKHKLTQKQLLLHEGKKGRKPTHETLTRESDWVTYYGSNEALCADVKALGGDSFIREILHLCADKINLTYWEAYFQFTYNVLLDELAYNSNILGSFYKGKVHI